MKGEMKKERIKGGDIRKKGKKNTKGMGMKETRK
jgi:hypothetical protein